MKQVHDRARRRRGFTLSELLIVLGILAVLTAVTVPAVLHYQQELKYTELDDNARAIFVAAQNRLTALRSTSSGELDLSAGAGRPAAEVPAGAVDGLESGTELWYVSTDVAGAEPDWLVLPGAIESDLAGGCYLVEFDPASGSVYGVFFLERNGSRTLNEATYQKIYQYTDGGNSCRVKDGRRAFARSAGGFAVGYYGADGAWDVARPKSKTLPKPTVELINAEELVLKIGSDPEWPSDIDLSKIYLSVTVSDGETSKTLVKEGAFRSLTTNTVVLDTLKTSGYKRNETNIAGWTVGGSFAQWMEQDGGYAITPGKDVTVSVTSWYKPNSEEGVVALPQTTSVTVNSLFASRGTTRVWDERDRPEEVPVVNVAYGRHLQNLNSATSHLDPAITAARQVREIDFTKTGDPEHAEDNVYYWMDTYGDRAFTPITDPDLHNYDGQNLPIRHLNAGQSPEGDSGLFGRFTGRGGQNLYNASLDKVVLVDAKAGGKYAGALAGRAENATVSGCLVYLTPSSGSTYSAATRIRGTSYAGGLVGYGENLLTQSGWSASTVVEGGVVGGAVGGGQDLYISRGYAAGHLSGNTVGGLVGRGANVEIQNAYAAGTIARATSLAGGLSAGATAKITNAYAAVDYVDVASAEKVYGAVPSGVGANGKVFYLAKAGVNDKETVARVEKVTDPMQMRDIKVSQSTTSPIFTNGGVEDIKAVPYNLPNQPDGSRDPKLYAPYPYPTLTVGLQPNKVDVTHYGDWLATSEASFFTYYECYTDGTYGFADPYEEGQSTVVTGHPLRNGADAVVAEDGYAVLAVTQPNLTIDGETVALHKVEGVSFSIDDQAHDLYLLDGGWIQTHHGYHEVLLGGSLWFDPDFAKTVTTTKVAATDTIKNYSIRSVRQLDNIDDPLYTGSDVTFDQDLTIDGAAYVGAVYGKSAGEWTTLPAQYAETPFAGTLDGHRDKGFMIRNLSITGTTRAGLFEEIGTGAVVRNVALASVKVNGTDWSQAYIGGLAGVISGGEVSNSGVFVVDAAGDTRNAPYGDYPVTATNGNEVGVGGLAGMVTGGQVSKCFAAVKVTGGNAGGLIGRLTGGQVRDCYAAGHTVNGVFEGPYSGGGVNITGSATAGGFVADWTGGTIAGTCYTTLSVDGGWNGKAGAFAGTHPAGAKLTGGYARSYVYQGGSLVSPADVAELGLDTSNYTGEKGPANPYDSTLSTEYDFKPISGLEHYGDWSLKKLRGLVAYYEQVELPRDNSWDPLNLKTEFFYYEREKAPSGGYVLTEKGTLDKTRTGALYSDGYAFLSLNQLHETGQESRPVILKIDIGGSATLADMEEYPTTYLGGFNADLTPFVEKWDGTKPYYYAYGLPNAALDVAANADEYFLQLKVAGLDSEAEQSSLWLNPHFGRTAYNGYGETNPKDGEPRVKIPDATGDVIPIRSVRQFNNMRKYPSDIRSWTQELDLDGSAYKGHVDVDGEGYLTVGGLRVATQSGGTWSPVKAPSATPTTADLPQSYRLEIEPIYMTSSGKSVTFGGAYDGGGHTIREMSIRTTTVGSDQYAALFYRLSGSGALKNVQLADSAIQGVSASGNNYTGALVGYTEGTVVNCTARNCTVTQENGNSKSYVGGLVGYARDGQIGVDEAGTAGPCAAVNCAVDGGASDSVGGFVGYVRGATLQNCGARVEAATVGGAKKTAADLYDTQLVQGNSQVGGFAGGVEEGSVQYCYAAVKVRGGTAGGFAGKLLDKKDKSVVKDSYAAGHTRNGVYAANDPNVMGEKAAGGFLGAWSGGTLEGLCYTTCSAGTVSGGLDVFAPASGKTAPAGGYAGGDVMKSGAAQDVTKYNVTKAAVRPLAERPAAEQGEAAPYDRTLPQKYSHQPITLPDGSAMPHYGDWYHKKTSASREWVQQLPDSNSRTFDNLEVSVDWQADALHLNFDVFHDALSGQDIANAGVFTNGVYAITTDLGYRLLFRIVRHYDAETETNVGYDILGLDGFVWNSKRVALDGTDYDAKPDSEKDGNYHDTLDFTIPLEMIPPHVRYIYIGFLEDDYLAVIEHDHSGTLDPRDQAVAHLPLDASITVDGDFSDWLGYEHKIMEFLPGAEQTPLYGHTTGSILGYENKIYLHVINEDKDDIQPRETLGAAPIFNFNFRTNRDNIPLDWLAQMRQQPYPDTVPSTREYIGGPDVWFQDEETWQWDHKQYDVFHIFLSVTEDREEYEMEIDLDALAQSIGEENGDIFHDFAFVFPDPWGTLEAVRDPKT